MFLVRNIAQLAAEKDKQTNKHNNSSSNNNNNSTPGKSKAKPVAIFVSLDSCLFQ